MPETVVNEGLVKFSKPFSFEGKTYEEIDVSGVAELSTGELIEAEELLAKTGTQAMVPEVSFPYLLIIAAKATGKPQEFFKALPAREGLKVKRAVMGFLNKEE